jgi:hypothetical protein
VARRSQRKGFGWKRWSNGVVYGMWGIFCDYRIVYTRAKARISRTDAFAAAGCRKSACPVRCGGDDRAIPRRFNRRKNGQNRSACEALPPPGT